MGLGGAERETVGAHAKPRRARRGSVRHRVGSALLLVNHVVISGCFAWGQVPPSALTPPSGRPVQVWTADSEKVVKWASITSDSLMGTPKAMSKDVPLETIRWPLAGVDSVRIKKFSVTQTLLATIGVVGALSFIIVVSGGLYGENTD